MIHDARFCLLKGKQTVMTSITNRLKSQNCNHDKINHATSPDDFPAGFYYVKFVAKVKTLIVSSVNKVY